MDKYYDLEISKLQSSLSLDLSVWWHFSFSLYMQWLLKKESLRDYYTSFVKMMGKYINSFYCHNNCKINHITFYCYLFSFYICKTEQHYKVHTANIHQCKLSPWWQFISWKWEGENNQPTNPRKAGENITQKFHSCYKSFLFHCLFLFLSSWPVFQW